MTQFMIVANVSVGVFVSKDAIEQKLSGFTYMLIASCHIGLKISKAGPYSIMSDGHGADPGFLAVSPQVT